MDLEQPDPAILDDDQSMADKVVDIVAALALLDMSFAEKYTLFFSFPYFRDYPTLSELISSNYKKMKPIFCLKLNDFDYNIFGFLVDNLNRC